MSASFLSACGVRAADAALLPTVQPPTTPADPLEGTVQHRRQCDGTVPWLMAKVEARNLDDLPKLIARLKELHKTHANVSAWMEEDGTHRVAAHRDCSAPQLQRVIDWLRVGNFCHGAPEVKCPLRVGDVSVVYCETATAISSCVLCKTPNKRGGYLMIASPLASIARRDDEGDRGQRTIASAPTNKSNFAPIGDTWAAGESPDVVVTTRMTVRLPGGDGALQSALSWVYKEGPLFDGPVIGVQWSLEEARPLSIPDPKSFGGGQFITTARRVLLGSMLEARPRLVEPWLRAEAQGADSDACARLLAAAHQQTVVDVEWRGSSEHDRVLCASLPAATCLVHLRDLLFGGGGDGSCTFTFDSWRVMPGDPLPPREPAPPPAREFTPVKTLQGLAAVAVGCELAAIPSAADRRDAARSVLEVLPPHLGDLVASTARDVLQARDDGHARQLVCELRRARGLRELASMNQYMDEPWRWML